MRRATPIFATISAAALAFRGITGCSSAGGHEGEGCAELCERQAACPDPLKSEEQCVKDCENDRQIAITAGCEAQLNLSIECAGHAENACDPAAVNEECSIQQDALETCLGGGGS